MPDFYLECTKFNFDWGLESLPGPLAGFGKGKGKGMKEEGERRGRGKEMENGRRMEGNGREEKGREGKGSEGKKFSNPSLIFFLRAPLLITKSDR